MNMVLRVLLEAEDIIILGCMGRSIMLKLSSGMLIEKQSKSQNDVIETTTYVCCIFFQRVSILERVVSRMLE